MTAGATAALARVREADAALNAAGPTPFPVPLGGLAEVVAGAVTGLQAGDWYVPGLRERVGAVLRDVPVDRLVDAFAGARPYKVAPADVAPALRALVAVGLAATDPARVALVHLGVGSCSDGAFYEALNLAALLKPNVIFLVAVDPLGEGAPLGPQLAASPAELARAFGLATAVVSGRDAEAVALAVAGARAARGPHLIEARLA